MNHLLTKPYKTRAAALKASKSVLGNRNLTDDERVLAIPGGFAALAGFGRMNGDLYAPADVFHGAVGAATRRQLV